MHYLRAALVVAAALVILRPAPSFAQIDEIRIAVDGLTCNLCAAGLERSLRRLEGVSTVKVALAEQTATVTLKPGAAFDADTFRRAVRDAGQEPRQIDLRVRGAVHQHAGGYRLQPATGPALAVGRSSAAAILAHVGKAVRVRARVSSAAREPLELEVTHVAR